MTLEDSEPICSLVKKICYIVAPVSMPKGLLKKVRKRAKENYGERKFSHHVCNVLAADLNQPPKTESSP